jgi:2-succinyl-6-hydroxy-2,4-cyclohexadiene-1-carboxylate synthase
MKDPVKDPMREASTHIQVGGVSYHCRSGGSGPPVLLLHGFMGSLAMWQPWWDAWGSTCRLLAVDFLGHGRSDAIRRDGPADMKRTVDDLLALMDHEHFDRVDVVGYSMGGRVALALAVSHPNRVRRVILESASPGLQGSEARRLRWQQDDERALMLETDGLERFVRYWESLPLFASQTQLNAEVIAAIRRSRLDNRAIGLAASLRELSTGRQPSYWGALPSVSAPALLITGASDEKFSHIAQTMREVMPNATWQEVPAVGHAVHLEAPDVFGALVQSSLTQG